MTKNQEMWKMGFILKNEETMDYVTAFNGDNFDITSVM